METGLADMVRDAPVSRALHAYLYMCSIKGVIVYVRLLRACIYHGTLRLSSFHKDA